MFFVLINVQKMENSQFNKNTFKEVEEHTNEEALSCALLSAESCPDQFDEETKQEVGYISVLTEPTTSSFVIESTECIIKKQSETKITKQILNKIRRAKRNNKLISSIIKQNKWQKVRYLPSKLFVKRMNAKKPVSESKYKYQVQKKIKDLFSIKKQIHKQCNGEENSCVNNIAFNKDKIRSDQFEYGSSLNMLAKQLNSASTKASLKHIKDASTVTVCCSLSDVETQTSYDINTSSVATQTDYSIRQFSDQLKYNCHFCKKVYKGMGALENHMKKHIQKFLKFYCKTCEKSFENSTVLANHVCVTSITPFPMITYYDDVDLVNIPVYKCGNCDAQFLTEGCYNEHKSKVHNNQEKVFTCIFCSEVLNTESALHAHLENHLLFIVN